jgi:eukaryotic-like serine/threonine-protein kinase
MADSAEDTRSGQVDRLDNLAMRLWQLWQADAEPDAWQLLRDAEPLDLDDILEVLRVDQRQRWQRGKQLLAEIYFEWYPDLARNPERALHLIYGEYVLREEIGPAPDPAEYSRRFPQHAVRFEQQLQFHQAIERVEATTISGASADSRTGEIAFPFDARTTRWSPDGSPFPMVSGYEILGELGRGAMGVVYRARQKGLNRAVALKMILAGQLASLQEVRRFEMEATAIAELDHPNIVPIFDVGYDHGHHYFSMKLIEHGNLARELPGLRRDIRAAIQLLVLVTRAVHYAHQRGILHRDLKPANILLDASGTPHVADFGLAKRVAEEAAVTQSGAIVGTPGYMAPEQARGERGITTAADVHGLGAILYEFLTGRPPFQAATPLDTLLQVLEREATPPRSLNPSADRELETVSLKCLEKDPVRRYQSAAALADDLQRWLRGEAITIRSVTSLERLRRWCRRNKLVALFAVVTLIAFLLASIVSTLFAIDAHQAASRADAKADEASHEARAARMAEEKARAAEKETKLQLYVSQMNLAQRAWEDGNAGRTRELLAAQLPGQAGDADPRGWEWRYLSRICHSELSILNFRALCLAFTPNGETLVAGGEDGTLKMWDAISLRESRSFKAHTNRITGVTFSADGRRFLTNSTEGKARLWETATVRLLHEFPTSRLVFGAMATLGPDGEAVAVCRDASTLALCDASGKEIHSLERNGGCIRGLAFSPDGKLLASGDMNGTAKVWDTATGNELRAFPGLGSLMAVAFSPDGRKLFFGAERTTLRCRDVGTWKESTVYQDPGSFPSLAFNPDGTRIASILGGPAIWDTATGHLLEQFLGHEDSVTSVAFSSRLRCLVSGSWDGTIRLWDVASHQGPWVVPKAGVHTVACSHDGTLLALQTNSSLSVRELHGGLELWAEREDSNVNVKFIHGQNVAFDPRGDFVVSGLGDGSVHVRDARGGQLLRTLKNHAGSVGCLDLRPDGSLLATGGQDGRVVLNELSGSYASRELLKRKGQVCCVAFSPDGKLLAAGGTDDASMRLSVWDVASGTRKEGFADLVGDGDTISLAFSPDGKQLAAGSNDNSIRWWDVATGRLLSTRKAHNGSVFTLSWSPDGRRLASGSADDKVKIWDVELGQEVLTLNPTGAQVTSIVWHPDSERLLAGCNRAVVWDARPLTSDVRAEVARISAATRYTSNSNANDPYWYFQRAPLLVHFDDIPRYRALRQEILARFFWSNDSTTIERLTRACTLLPLERGDDIERLLEMTDRALANLPREPVFRLSCMVARATVEYRRGDFTTAAERLEKAVAEGKTLWWGYQSPALLMLALAQQRGGSAVKARDTLAREAELWQREAPATSEAAGGLWHDWLMRDILRREAEDVVLRNNSAASDAPRTWQPLPDRDKDWFTWTDRGKTQLRAGNLAKAADAFARAVDLHSDDVRLSCQLATLLAATDAAKYDRHRLEMSRRWSTISDTGDIDRICKACLLLPGDSKAFHATVQLATKLDDAKNPDFGLTLALAAFRAGSFVETERRLDRLLATDQKPWPVEAAAWSVLALARHRCGERDAARKALGQTDAMLSMPPARAKEHGVYSDSWQDLLTVEILYREARSTIATK